MEKTVAVKSRSLLKELLQNEIRAGLAYLNSTSNHRFTALYRFDGDMIRSLYFYDRENPDIEIGDDVPLQASYCVFVNNQKRKWMTENSEADPRADGHSKQFVVRSYCGVPLVDDTGKVFGSVCHFDFEAKLFSATTVELLEAVADLLPDVIEH